MDQQITLAKLLRIPIESFCYEDIVAFLDSKEPEGLHLDYKESISANSLKKHFAAFSNKYGGLIIIGVSEDKKSSLPIRSNGTEFDAKSVEQLHQIASNIDPLPNYKIHKVEKDGKGFILIRIIEGGEPPYFVLNDSSVYVRTGNITKEFSERFDRATSEELRNLLNKNNDAELARDSNEKFIGNIYKAQLQRGEKERLRKVQNDEKTLDFKLGEHCVFAEMIVQPSYPKTQLFKPHDLKEFVINNHLYVGGSSSFPSVSWNYEPIPEGIASFQWSNWDGAINNFQLFSNGAVYYLNDILRTLQDKSQVVYLHSVCAHIILTLRFANLYYTKGGYQGPVKGKFKIKNIDGIPLKRISYNDFWFDDDPKVGLLNSYQLNISTNTVQLNDTDARKQLETGIIRDVHWYFGFETKDWDKVYEKFLNDEFK